MQPTKICRICGGEFTYDALRQNKKSPDGVERFCKKCYSDYLRQWRIDHREQYLKAIQDWQKRNPDKVRKYSRDYYARDPRKQRNREKDWRAKHPAERLERDRRYRRTHPEHVQRTAHQYKTTHRAKVLLARKQWAINNPEKERARLSRRRARRRGLPSKFTYAQAQRCWECFGASCAYCGLHTTDLDYEHVIPLSPSYTLSGDNPGTVVTNIVPACRSCNSSKRNKEVVVWLTSRYGAQQAAIIYARILEYFELVADEQ